MSIHARPRATIDIDLRAPPAVVASIADALAPWVPSQNGNVLPMRPRTARRRVRLDNL
jgi:hypothetical protein